MATSSNLIVGNLQDIATATICLGIQPRALERPRPDNSIALVDDEEALRQVLRARLTARGYSIHEASSGEEVLQTVPVLRPDVIILDIGLPDIDGIEVTRRLRPLVQTPIIILSVHATESDKIAALDAGADDYLTKPCDLGELLDRIRTALRRATLQDTRIFAAGDLVVDLNCHMVQVANNPIQLTVMEYDLLKVLVLNAGKLLTQNRLAKEIWGAKEAMTTARYKCCGSRSARSARSWMPIARNPAISRRNPVWDIGFESRHRFKPCAHASSRLACRGTPGGAESRKR